MYWSTWYYSAVIMSPSKNDHAFLKSLLFNEKVEIGVISNNNASSFIDMFEAWILLFPLLLGKLMLPSNTFKTDLYISID